MKELCATHTCLLCLMILCVCAYSASLRNGAPIENELNAELASRILVTLASPDELAQQKQRKKIHRQNYIPYTDEENVVRKVAVRWDDFVTAGHQAARTKPYMRSSTLKSLQQCTVEPAQTCKEAMGDALITTWKTRKVNELCEENATSKIQCFDSTGKSRFCIFENAMMNFQKLRKRKVDGGNTARSWERGFLSADCGEMAPDDIGYLPLYKPDIENREEASCDFVFNETVLAYSHENIRNYGLMSNDYMNVWSMLWLAGVSQVSRDVTFLNIDGIKKGKYFADLPNQFFRTYNVSFRRILKASDFADTKAKVCFKRLLMQPRPVLQFHADDPKCPTDSANLGAALQASNGALGASISSNNQAQALAHPGAGASALFQRWNLQIRQNYGLLRYETMPTISAMQILLVVRTPPVSGPNTTHVLSRMYTNTAEIRSSLQAFIQQRSAADPSLRTTLAVHDFLSVPFAEQVRLIASSSIVIGMHGAGIASSMHMAVGTKYCCGVIEIFPEGEFKSIRGYGNMARRMGHYYERLNVAPEHTSLQGTVVPVAKLSIALESVTARILSKGGSCFLPEVINTPYL